MATSSAPTVDCEMLHPILFVKDLPAAIDLSSCLEEILLHTNEPLGNGVASPHTKSDLRYIKKLKAKYGIDYDCHASYRFEE